MGGKSGLDGERNFAVVETRFCSCFLIFCHRLMGLSQWHVQIPLGPLFHWCRDYNRLTVPESRQQLRLNPKLNLRSHNVTLYHACLEALVLRMYIGMCIQWNYLL
jgi:hypothetical protein